MFSVQTLPEHEWIEDVKCFRGADEWMIKRTIC